MNMRIFLRSLAALMLLGTSAAALAHHPNISAEGVCDTATGGYSINYTSTSWCSDPENLGCGHSTISVEVDGVVVDSGAYVAPTYSFSGSAGTTKSAGDTVTVTATAVGPWDSGADGGQMASTTITLQEDPECQPAVNGRFTGGGKQLMIDLPRGTLHVTRGFTLHCDLLLSNNLEVNWSGGNKFHMTEHLSAICLDNPVFDPFPPVAPVDTLIGVGTGRYNGDDGYTIRWQMEDHGEPGSEDQMSILIYETANPGNVVLDVPLQKLVGGNIQAHFDQPHK